MTLSIEKYDYEEKKGRIDLSNRFIRAFSPGFFEKGGFPTRVVFEQELSRYIDSQHGECYEDYFNNLCRGISNEELKIVFNLTKNIFQMTYLNYNKEFVVKAPVLAALKSYRVIETLCERENNYRIMEIGAGSGILGALLLQQKYKYMCTDVTQAFYLIQNRIFNYFVEVNDLCDTETINYDNDCIHIPYWKLWSLKDKIKDVDIMICNRALLEMHPNAVRFYLKLGIKAMKNSKLGYFVFQGAGWNSERKIDYLFDLFNEYDYKLVFYDEQDEMAIFSLFGDGCIHEVIENKDDTEKDNGQVMHVYLLGDVNKSKKSDYRKVYYSSDGEKISKAFIKMELDDKVSISKLNDLYNSITLNQDSPDEEFANYLK